MATPAKLLAEEPPLTASVESEKFPEKIELTVEESGVAGSSTSSGRDAEPEAVGASLNQQAAKYYYSGQLPPMNTLNPAAWKSFINSWKKGEFKSKN